MGDSELIDRDEFEMREMPEEFTTERFGTGGGAVLQGCATGIGSGQDFVGDLSNFGDGESCRIDETGGQGENIGIFDSLLHQIADGLTTGPVPTTAEGKGRKRNGGRIGCGHQRRTQHNRTDRGTVCPFEGHSPRVTSLSLP